MKNIKLESVCLFVFFMFIEILFRFHAGTLGLNILLLRSVLYAFFNMSVLLLLNAISKNKVITGISLGYTFLISTYAFVQVGMKSYYEAFFSFRFLTQDVPNVQSYAGDFIRFLKPSFFLYFIVFLVFAYVYLQLRKKQSLLNGYQVILIFVLIPIFFLSTYVLSLQFDGTAYIESSFNLYKNPFYTENAMNQLGVVATMTTDLQYIVFPKRAVAKVDVIPDVPKEEKPEPPKLDPNIRVIDDLQWQEVIDTEENEALRNIDQYFINQKISLRNEYTGLFEDKNLVFFLVEAFDELAIHPDITPTLYKLKTEGIYFNQFQSPQFNCATAESELMSVSGLLPVVGSCTMANHYENTNNQTIYRLFKDKGYHTSSFHNWNDQFYPRTVIHPYLGSDVYKDEPQTIPSRVSGWQSDLTMMKTVVKDLNSIDDNKPFMSYVITSTTHFPYDKPSHLGDAHAGKVKQFKPDAPDDIVRYLSKSVELDLSIKYLMDHLETMDDTVLVLFSDHRPFKMPSTLIVENADNTNKGSHYDSTPMMIYTPGITPEINSKVSSTVDLTPTLANLFNLKYDPRLFMGQDIFSTENNIVINQSGSWRDQVGKYDSAKGIFEPYDENNTYSDDQLKLRNAQVKQRLAISSSIYLEGYFKERPFLGR